MSKIFVIYLMKVFLMIESINGDLKNLNKKFLSSSGRKSSSNSNELTEALVISHEVRKFNRNDRVAICESLISHYSY